MPRRPRRLGKPVSPFHEAMKANTLRIAPLVSAQLLWDRVLTPTDRYHLGNHLVAAYKLYGTAGMWARLRGVSAPRAVVDVAGALDFITPQTRHWLLRELGEVHDDPEEAIAAAVAAGGLVLVDRPREAYWAGARIAVDWQQRTALWDYLRQLAKCSKTGCAVDPTELGAEGAPEAAVKQKSRLVGLPGGHGARRRACSHRARAA